MIRKVFCKLTGYRYHYRGSFKYQTKEGHQISAITFSFNAVHPALANNHREVKRAMASLIIERTPKHLLCNGEIVFEPLFYCGFYRAKP